MNAVRNMPPVTKNLIIICLIVFLAEQVSSIGSVIFNYGSLHYFDATLFNPAQLVSYMFLHGNFAHIFFNMFTLFMFGITLEHTLGSRRFLIYYMVCGIGAALVQEAVWSLTAFNSLAEQLALLNGVSTAEMHQYMEMNPEFLSQAYNNLSTVGASGAIYGLLLAFAMLFPNRPMYFLFIPVPIKAKWMMLIWGVLEFSLGVGKAADGIAHFAHLGGMIFGIMLILYWKKKGIIHGDFY